MLGQSCDIGQTIIQHFGDAEVSNFDASPRVEQDVLRLDVPGQHAFIMSKLKGFTYVWNNR
jgi:hypothetical protein